VLLGVKVASDDRKFPHIETGLLQFLDRDFRRDVRRINGDDGFVLVSIAPPLIFFGFG
jgi:hypothetical protein